MGSPLFGSKPTFSRSNTKCPLCSQPKTCSGGTADSKGEIQGDSRDQMEPNYGIWDQNAILDHPDRLGDDPGRVQGWESVF